MQCPTVRQPSCLHTAAIYHFLAGCGDTCLASQLRWEDPFSSGVRAQPGQHSLVPGLCPLLGGSRKPKREMSPALEEKPHGTAETQGASAAWMMAAATEDWG